VTWFFLPLFSRPALVSEQVRKRRSGGDGVVISAVLLVWIGSIAECSMLVSSGETMIVYRAPGGTVVWDQVEC